MTQTRLSGQLIRSSSVSASAIVGAVTSASFAVTASFALNGGGGNIATFTTLIGNNVSSSFTVAHNLNNTNVMTQVVREASGSFVYPDITISGSNALTVAFSIIPSSNEYRVNVVGF